MLDIYSMEDIFDQIIRRDIPAEIVYEDDQTLAFLDINPNNPGSTLVIPKKHARNIFDVEPETLAAVMETARKIAVALRAAVDADGINLIMNNEETAAQAVFHLHVHVIPRFEGDGRWFASWPHNGYAEGQRAEVAEKIRARLAR